MQPGSSTAPSSAWTAGSTPARERIAGRTLGPLAGTWRTTTTGAAKSAGRARTNALSASTPPAEAPTTTTSQLFSGTSCSLPAWPFVNPLSRALCRSEPAVGPDGERGAEAEGDRRRPQHVLVRALEEAPAGGEHERDRVHNRHGVDPAGEEAERDVHRGEEQHHEDGRLHQRPRLRRSEPH